MLSDEQRKIVANLYPAVCQQARCLDRDDEAVGIAGLALCEAVLAYDPGRGMKLSNYVKRRVEQAVRKWQAGRRNERPKPLATERNPLGEAVASVDDTIAWNDLISGLPKSLRQIATARWRGRYTYRELEDRFGIKSAHRLVQRAEVYARLYLNSQPRGKWRVRVRKPFVQPQRRFIRCARCRNLYYDFDLHTADDGISEVCSFCLRDKGVRL